mmetsp:Transcript_72800/g.200901  ORF Transcript_72800/g.200901 Transcript_72800/m.200901 type:complete len:527 (-) Transcript_72800:285-1865(-)
MDTASPIVEKESSRGSSSGAGPSWKPLLLAVGGAAVVAGLLGGVVGGLIGSRGGGGAGGSASPAAELRGLIPGTNIGGWLHLEDWFFSGSEGRWVSTPGNKGQGGCFPPMVSSLDEPWPSEGILVHRLNKMYGPAKTVDAFAAHRRSYISHRDLEQIALLGIKLVRVPLTWAVFADALAAVDPDTYAGFNPLNESVIVPDPYYTDSVAYVTVPRDYVEEVLRDGAAVGLKFVLDMHCMPGGSSQGTYNGIFPKDPMFWKANAKLGNGSVTLESTGLLITDAMIRWVEGMDEKTRSAIAGVTFMNEPAHINAYLQGPARFAEDQQVLDWLAASAERFRRSSLPGLGIRLYLQILDTGIRQFWSVVPAWWRKTFSAEERSNWAVIDLHWYSAWSGEHCSGRVSDGGAYFCYQSLDTMRKVWREGDCAREWAKKFRDHFPDTTHRVCSEMSATTYHDAFLACNDEKVTRTFVVQQAKDMAEFGVEPFFWTWRVPYGPAFESGWSLKHIAGLEDATPPRPCKPNFTILSV